MATYLSLRATAQRLIQKNGRSVSYTQKGGTLLDVNNPHHGVTGSTVTSVKAAFINDVITEKSKNLVQQGDKICLIAADDLPSIVPSTRDFIVDGSTNYDIQDVESIDPSDAPVVYQFVLRG